MVMNQDAKVGLIVLGLVALGILFAVESSGTPHQQFDPRFTLVVIVDRRHLFCRKLEAKAPAPAKSMHATKMPSAM
jgi:hypothetical protein